MDPDTVWYDMFDHMNHGEYLEARECAIALDTWLQNGGFFPSLCSPIVVRSYVNSVLRRTWSYTEEANPVEVPAWLQDQAMTTCPVDVQAILLRSACPGTHKTQAVLDMCAQAGRKVITVVGQPQPTIAVLDAGRVRILRPVNE